MFRQDDDGNVAAAAAGAVVYEPFLPGRILGWDQRLWVLGTDLVAAGWPARNAPWGAKQQCRNGQLVDDMLRDVIHPSLAGLVALRVAAPQGQHAAGLPCGRGRA